MQEKLNYFPPLVEVMNLNTEGVLSDGERVYTYSAVSGGSEAITQVLQHLQLVLRFSLR